LKFLFHQNIFLVFLFNKFSFIVSLMSIMYRRMAIQMKKKKGGDNTESKNSLAANNFKYFSFKEKKEKRRANGRRATHSFTMHF